MDVVVSGKSAREQRADRAKVLAEVRETQARAARRKKTAVIAGGAVAVALVGSLVTVAVIQDPPTTRAEDIRVEGVQEFADLGNAHVATPVTYDQSPPVGGNHAAAWLNCGEYSQPVPNENAVHALEHGAVWVTYDPAVISGGQVQVLRDELPDTYTVLSPLEGTASPVMMSAWGIQVGVEKVDDPRVELFGSKYVRSPKAPEPGAPCTGGIDAPGRTS